MDFQEFLTGQDEIYARFRDTSKFDTGGTKPNIPVSQGAYLIAFRHPDAITEKIEKFSRRLSQVIPLIVYNSSAIHTTISDFGVSEDFIPEESTFRRLCDVVGNAVITKSPAISYPGWLYNQDTIILAGTPDQAFLDVAEGVCSSGRRKGFDLRLPWGAHITADRFSEQRSPAELRDFVTLMKEAPVLGVSVPKYIDVACLNLSPRGFAITTYERFDLKG